MTVEADLQRYSRIPTHNKCKQGHEYIYATPLGPHTYACPVCEVIALRAEVEQFEKALRKIADGTVEHSFRQTALDALTRKEG